MKYSQDLERYFQGFTTPVVSLADLPLPEEPHVGRWREYLKMSRGRDMFATLQEKLPQLCIPQHPGISTSAAYAAVMRKGAPFSTTNFDGRLVLERPDLLTLEIHSHFAGALPVLGTTHREDFVRLVNAIGNRCEPTTIPEGVHAKCIGGINNWDRVNLLHDLWNKGQVFRVPGEHWGTALQRAAKEEPDTIRDRVVLLHQAPYGSVGYSDAPGIPDVAAWLAASGKLRIEHEFTHYATKRIYGQMRSNMLDELIADCIGFTASLGTFSAALFQRCMGIDNKARIPQGARVWEYLQGLSRAEAMAVVEVTLKAAENLQRALTMRPCPAGPGLLLGLAALTLPQMAASDGAGVITSTLDRLAG